VSKPARIRVPESTQRQVVEVWKNNPGFGPTQVRNQLRRVGVRCDTKTIRKILKAHGYTPPQVKPPRSGEDRRFEAAHPLELVQMDVLHFYVHAQRLYLFLALDDHSRFLTGWALLQRESMDDAIAVLEESIRRFGKPEAVLTDRGATFHSWAGIGRFDRVLEAYDIDHILASAGHPQTCGKIEAVNKAIQKELIDRVEFRNFLDAKAQIASWIDTYNHERTHQGIGGVLVPADRFYGRADQVLSRIEGGLSKGSDPVPPELTIKEEEREVSLFQIRFVGGIIELWLFGRCVARLKGQEEV
jgi:transposase InsO family protein